MKSPTFCVLPYYCYETNGQTLDNIHCCRWPAGTDVNDVRASIKLGEKHPACSTCWAAEEHGDDSERHIHNRTMDWILDRDIDRICNAALDGEYSTQMVKLYTSNICNGTCVTCGPNSSTAWQKLAGIPIKYQQQDLPDIDWQQVRYLSLVGGEPLLEKKNWDIFDQLISIGNTDLFVTIVTNGSTDITQYNIDVLKKFKNLNFCVSIDGIGPVFEYMRYPLKWSVLESNLDLLRSITDNISVSSMVSNLNVYYLKELDEWIHQQGLTVLYKAVAEPSVFSPGNLPYHLKETVESHCGDIAQQFLSTSTTSSWDDLLKEVDRQDQLKGIRIRDYLEKWGSLIQRYLE